VVREKNIVRFRFLPYANVTKILKNRRLMKCAPYWSSAKLQEWSWERRRAVLRNAVLNVPFYREAYKLSIEEVAKFTSEDDWCRLPTIDKQVVLQQPTSFLSDVRNLRKCVWTHTSGSSGRKLNILLDDNVNAAAFSLFWRAWSSGGYWRLGQRHAVMKGSSAASGLYVNRKIRALEISSSHVTHEFVEQIAQKLIDYRPKFMRGYPSSMYHLCKLLEEKKIELDIPMVSTGSETLHDFQRKKFEEVLGARVFNHYAHWERAASILECQSGQLHAQEDFGVHEILDAGGSPVPPGTPGEITVTSLHNMAMPLIRYRTGDIGTWGDVQCSCGQVFPVVQSIEGRLNDSIVKSDGTIISGTYAAGSFLLNTKILSAQLIQDDYDVVEVRIVKGQNYVDPTDTQEIVKALESRIGKDFRLEIRYCELDELERNPVGKMRQVLNRIGDLNFDQIQKGISWTENRGNQKKIST